MKKIYPKATPGRPTPFSRPKSWILPVLCGLFATTVSATAGNPELPPGALLDNAPNPGQWVITFSYPEDRQNKTAASATQSPPAYLGLRPRIITTTKSGNMISVDVTDINGNKRSIFFVGGTVYQKPPAATSWYTIQVGSSGRSPDPEAAPLPATGFRDLDWIAPSLYQGPTNYSGAECLVFVANPTEHLNFNDPASMDDAGTYVLVDLKARLPVMMEIDRVIRTYQFKDAPALTLPADLVDQLKKGAEARARLDMR